jgi:uncharacterized protein
VLTSMQQALAGQQLNAKQKKILDDVGREISALVKQELRWPAVEPMMIEVYRNTFSQREVDGMLAFYRSDVGQAVIDKLPTATHQTMTSIQRLAQTLTPKLVQLEKDTAAQLKAAGEPEQAGALPAGSASAAIIAACSGAATAALDPQVLTISRGAWDRSTGYILLFIVI